MDSFENSWRRKIKKAVFKHLDEKTADKILQKNLETERNDERDEVRDETRDDERDDAITWSNNLINNLETMDIVEKSGSVTKEGKIHDIITECACQYPRSPLEPIKQYFQSTKDLSGTHKMVQDLFRKDIKPAKNLTDEEVDQILSQGWGLAGILASDNNSDSNSKHDVRIIATKIPKEFHQYFSETEDNMKRFRYCHCPRIREALKKGIPDLNSNYCLCGAGFYRGLWEYILDSPVRVKVLKSVLTGDDVCQIEITLSNNL